MESASTTISIGEDKPSQSDTIVNPSNILPESAVDEIAPPKWLVSAREEADTMATHWLIYNGISAMAVVAVQFSVKGTNHKLHGPSPYYIFTSVGIFLASVILRSLLLNAYHASQTSHPMKKKRNRAVWGLFYITSISVPLLLLSSIFIPEKYIWAPLVVTCVLWIVKVVRCVVSEPVGSVAQQQNPPTGLQMNLNHTPPADTTDLENLAIQAQNLAISLVGNPSMLNSIPNPGEFAWGLQFIANQAPPIGKLAYLAQNLAFALVGNPSVLNGMPNQVEFAQGLQFIANQTPSIANPAYLAQNLAWDLLINLSMLLSIPNRREFVLAILFIEKQAQSNDDTTS